MKFNRVHAGGAAVCNSNRSISLKRRLCSGLGDVCIVQGWIGNSGVACSGGPLVEVGGLMAYGVDLADVNRRLAGIVGQVLGGAKVSDIPFYRQTKFELVLNQKAATSLRLEFPPSLLTTADDVID